VLPDVVFLANKDYQKRKHDLQTDQTDRRTYSDNHALKGCMLNASVIALHLISLSNLFLYVHAVLVKS